MTTAEVDVFGLKVFRNRQTSIHVKNYDLERRRLSADATLHRSMLDLKQREALRRIVDTKNRLEVIYIKQRELNQNAAIAEQDRRAAELMTKMAVCIRFF
ncbi:unnamed protein product [Rotaria magnacalcarata]|uniref:Uncharacterized protein n=1 Tax=Rotaria magnacalcarata TaxID=392030 RepID=A0A8S3IXX5_9BILA|nr:unnamed protein product [Rotaria magnacalcarata]